MDCPVEFSCDAVKQELPDYEDEPPVWSGGAEMITVKVEPVDTALTLPDGCESLQKVQRYNERPIAYPSHLLEDHNPAHFYIAKLSQKLNLKLNKVLTPQNENSVPNLAEPHCSGDSGENFEGEALKCTWCSSTVCNVEDLEQHQRVCDGSPSSEGSSDQCNPIDLDGIERRYECDFCGKKFARDCNLKRHYLTHPPQFVCVVCKASFPTAKTLKIHQFTHLKDLPYVCPKCNRGFPNREVLREHARVHIKDMPFSCRVCGKRFLQAKNLSFHMKIHSGITIFPCDECERGFDTDEERTAHKKQHKLVMPYKCGLCNQSFPTKRQRQKHSAIHDAENPQKCAHCDRRFAHEATYRAHIKTVHSKISVVCVDCDLLANSVTCDDTEEFMCEDCDLPFLHKNCLASHILAHSQKERVTCEKCSKGFPHVTAYHRHMLIHTGERPFKCTECALSFFTRTNLKEHMRKHWRERPFACKVCGEKFSFNNMMTHLLTHTGGKSVLTETGNALRNLQVNGQNELFRREGFPTNSSYIWSEGTSDEFEGSDFLSVSDAEMDNETGSE